MGLKFQAREPFLQSDNRHLYKVGDAAPTNLHILSLRLQTCSVTLGAGGLSPVTGQHHAVLNLVLILLHHIEEGIDARFLLFALVGGQPVPQPVFLFLCQVHIGLEDGEVVVGCMTAEPVEPLFHLLTVPTNNTAVVDGEGRVWDDKFLVDADDAPETLTLRTGTCRGVEGKHLVAGFFEHDTIGFKTCREVVADVGGREHQTEFTVTLEKSRLCRIHQTCDGILRIVDTQAVDDEIDTLGIGISRQFSKIIVDAYKVVVNEDTGITFEDIGLQLLLECAPLMQMNRRHHDETRSLRVFQHLLYDIFGGVFLHLLTADGGIRAPYARVK